MTPGLSALLAKGSTERQFRQHYGSRAAVGLKATFGDFADAAASLYSEPLHQAVFLCLALSGAYLTAAEVLARVQGVVPGATVAKLASFLRAETSTKLGNLLKCRLTVQDTLQGLGRKGYRGLRGLSFEDEKLLLYLLLKQQPDFYSVQQSGKDLFIALTDR
ncbi:hypothetical protein WJX73_002634 [Symbiochloris irregularis]|uniref:Uncharacterized protein n=1 Tax=Symbiochloris irregularis TaxID=706552 RepID=A0AAW1P040_9CHLO